MNEEKLTAYVMNEMPEAERQALDAAISRDPALAREVEELRRFCGNLWSELREEPMPRLTSAQLAALKAEIAAPPPRRRQIWLAAGMPALAAAVVAYVLVQPRFKADAPLSTGDAAEVRFDADVSDTAPVAPKASVAPKMVVEAKKKEARPVPLDAAKRASPMLANRAPSELGLSRASSPGKGSARPNGMALGDAKMVMSGDGRREADADFNTEAYDYTPENVFRSPASDPLSTFSVDVDTASYTNIRRFAAEGRLPPKDAVRIEEMINYFPYDYPAPGADRPFSVNAEVATAPWKAEHRLVRIGLKGQVGAFEARKDSNIVFLIDVSGSMNDPDKLPLLKTSLKLFVDKMDAHDRLAIAVYAGSSGLALPSTSGADKAVILEAIDRMQAGGATNGADGIRLAYDTARSHFIKGGLNRVILATDGDFNVGVSSQGELVRLIQEEAKSGVFLSVLGFGTGNLKDATMEQLADKGNGNYAYIDSLAEARKVLIEQAGGTLVTIAKDVKLQVEFNPAAVTAYRLIGYENRVLAHQDFNDDKKDAGEIGSGHSVTALYEVVPKGVKLDVPGVDPLKYQTPSGPSGGSGDLMTVKLRYKQPEGSKSSLAEYTVKDSGKALADATADFKFAAAVAETGLLLRGSAFKGSASFADAERLAAEGLGKDELGYRKGFVELLGRLKTLPASDR